MVFTGMLYADVAMKKPVYMLFDLNVVTGKWMRSKYCSFLFLSLSAFFLGAEMRVKIGFLFKKCMVEFSYKGLRR